MAEVSRLEGTRYMNIILSIAKEFKLDPDIVYQKSFDWVKNVSVTLKEEREFGDRYAEFDRLMNAQ